MTIPDELIERLSIELRVPVSFLTGSNCSNNKDIDEYIETLKSNLKLEQENDKY